MFLILILKQYEKLSQILIPSYYLYPQLPSPFIFLSFCRKYKEFNELTPSNDIEFATQKSGTMRFCLIQDQIKKY